MSEELRELAKRLGNPIAVADTTPAPGDAPVRPQRSIADEREPRSSLEKKLRAAAEREAAVPTRRGGG
jgi:hypothetical protein